VLDPSILNGKKVVGNDGNVLGEVDGIDFDLDNWKANALYVSLNDEATAELRLKKSFLGKIVLCLPTKLVEAVGEVITLKEPIRNLQDIAERGILASSTRISGKNVISAQGYILGVAEGFDLNLTSWEVKGLRVGLTDDAATKLGFKRPFVSKVAIIIPSKIIGLVGNFITLSETIDNLDSLVECIRSCQKQT
jgi:sporulation protein YlmC with PRC-barrel domain